MESTSGIDGVIEERTLFQAEDFYLTGSDSLN